MDPNAALQNWADAVARGDRYTANEAYVALRGWLERGGFEPDWALGGGRARFFSYNPRKETVMTLEPRPACQTTFLGPTDHRGSRVKATHCNTKRSVTLSWDHALGPLENHVAAARKLFKLQDGEPDLLYCSVNGGGYLFMVRG